MPLESRKTIQQLSGHLLTLDVVEYLESERFFRFCKEHDIDDIWMECLDFSRDKPNLFGDEVAKNAFLMLLQHTFNSKKDEFLKIIANLLKELPGMCPNPLFFPGIKKIDPAGFPAS